MVMKGLTGTVKKNFGLLPLIVLAVIVVGFIGNSLAASFTSAEEAQPTLRVSTIRTFNISVNNTNATTNITLAIGTNAGGGTLSGTFTTVAAVAGVATFSDLSINLTGTGYTLTAADAAALLTGATSSAFNITAGAADNPNSAKAPISGARSRRALRVMRCHKISLTRYLSQISDASGAGRTSARTGRSCCRRTARRPTADRSPSVPE